MSHRAQPSFYSFNVAARNLLLWVFVLFLRQALAMWPRLALNSQSSFLGLQVLGSLPPLYYLAEILAPVAHITFLWTMLQGGEHLGP
jgi:hypothetical protein